ncbi:Aluminum-activated malate transporter 7 [Linum grandiflorum]
MECLRSRVKEMALKNKVAGGSFMSVMAEVARDDPRRVIHSFKVGMALSFVSMFYYYKPLYNDFGVSSMWAVMTVLVVSEFSVGATLGKGLNRGMATLLAGALGIGAHHVASHFGHVGERVVTGFLVFLLAVVTTFVRFIPKLKARYDHGLVVFVSTFSFVSVSGYDGDKMLEVVWQRAATIMIGASVSVVVSMALLPVWAGFGDGYFEEQDCKAEDLVLRSSMLDYKSILNSRNSEESLASFARWEPGHGKFKFNHPWKHYLEIGALSRECAYQVETLNRYLAADVVQPQVEIRSKIKEPGKQMSIECGRALKQMSLAIKAMCTPCAADPHIESAKSASKTLNSLMKSTATVDMVQVAPPVAIVASLLVDMVNCIENICEATYELASKAEFRRFEKLDGQEVLVSNLARKTGCECDHVLIKVPNMVSKA